jgi:hypothetical protein
MRWNKREGGHTRIDVDTRGGESTKKPQTGEQEKALENPQTHEEGLLSKPQTHEEDGAGAEPTYWYRQMKA